ncbi:MAG TPA: YbhB/YbcL family Raf kinase inhibitor-like protein [Actinospica sp.]|nr:YbhB/YbcL family Raf kinase inhibitor-like protein [Actinospica sp.]
MALIGKLLMNRRAGEKDLAWNEVVLTGPETLTVSSPAFTDGGPIPFENAGRRIGGQNVSPALAWSELPADTAQVLVFIEDVDAPTAKPFVHCVAVVSPILAADGVPAGGLSRDTLGPGVSLLRAQFGSGYRGPEPIKGHGPHRYVFQVFALGTALPETVEGMPLTRIPPRKVPPLVASGSLLARGRITGTYER